MKKKAKVNKRPVFGMRWKMGIAVGLIVVVVSSASFALALYLHIATSLYSAIDMDIYSGRKIAETVDQYIMAEVLIEGKELYDSIPEEIRADRQSKEYLSRFDELKDYDYEFLKNQLVELAEFEDLKWLDLRVIDEENDRWVYIIDTDAKGDGRYQPGYWETGEETYDTTFVDESYDVSGTETSIDNDFDTDFDIDIDADAEAKDLSSQFADMIAIFRYVISLGRIKNISTVTALYHPHTGEFLGYIGTGERVEDYGEEVSLFWKTYLILLIIFLVAAFFVLDLVINRWLVHPLLDLSSAAADYVADTDKSKNEHYFDRVKISSHDELRLLKDSMLDMEEDLSRYVQDLEKMTAEKERAAVEMELSSRIQTSLLPKELENYSGDRGFAVNALIDPAKDVGGDFYDYYFIDDDHIGITIADVSDKGVPAALFMVVTRTLLQVTGGKTGSPSEVMEKVNRQLCAQNQEMMFVTVFFGVYTISEKKLVYVNAGHEDYALYRQSTGEFGLITDEHDFVMALMPDTKYTERTMYLEEGDKLFLYTDGVPEANNTDDEMFGNERMVGCLNEIKDLTGKEFLKKMRELVREFTGGAPQFDDVTMLLLEVRG